MSLYQTLGVEPDATQEEIRAAYRNRAKQAHPDAGGSDVEFRAIESAHRVLSDPEKRKIYDETGYSDLMSQEDLAVYRAAADLVLRAIEDCGPEADVIKVATQQIQGAITAVKRAAAELEARKARVVSALARLSAKGTSKNGIAPLLKEQIGQIDGQIMRTAQDQVLAARVLDFLGQHEYRADPPKPRDKNMTVSDLLREELAQALRNSGAGGRPFDPFGRTFT
jgi:curved DNA-binding protein CbpA